MTARHACAVYQSTKPFPAKVAVTGLAGIQRKRNAIGNGDFALFLGVVVGLVDEVGHGLATLTRPMAVAEQVNNAA